MHIYRGDHYSRDNTTNFYFHTGNKYGLNAAIRSNCSRIKGGRHRMKQFFTAIANNETHYHLSERTAAGTNRPVYPVETHYSNDRKVKQSIFSSQKQRTQ